MTNLLTRYQSQPTAKNAQAIRAYDRKHPMAACMLAPELFAVLSAALLHGTEG